MSERERTVVKAELAECESCDWSDQAGGALGRAAIHHDRTGHEVRIEVTRVIRYGNREAALEAQGQTRLEGMA